MLNIFIISKFNQNFSNYLKNQRVSKIMIFAHSLYFGFLYISKISVIIFKIRGFRKCFRVPKFNKIIKVAFFFFKFETTSFKNINRIFYFLSFLQQAGSTVGGSRLISVGELSKPQR